MLNYIFKLILCEYFYVHTSTLAIESPTNIISQYLSKIFAMLFEYAVKQTIFDFFFFKIIFLIWGSLF